MNKAKFAAQVAQLTADRVPFVLATVVRAQRTSVSPGDTAVILGDGAIEGFVGGQCAESSVRLYSLRALETGEPMLLRLTPDAADGDQAAVASDGAVVEHNPCLTGGSIEIFLEPQLPPARIVITGESPIARALEQLAVAAGYAVEPGFPADLGELAGATAVVVASHGHNEEPVLTAALSAGVPYVALVASEVRGAAVRDSLDLASELKGQLHTPAGVDIGAETPAEIAIAILAELVVIEHADPALGRPEAEVSTDELDRFEPAQTGDPAPQPESETVPAPEPVAESESESEPVAESEPVLAVGGEIPEPPQGNGDSEIRARSGDKHSGAARLRRAFATGKDRAPIALTPEDVIGQAAPNGEEFPYEAEAARGVVSTIEMEPETFGPDSELPPGTEVAIDPVCGMKVPIIETALHLDVAGSRRYFCGTGCRVAYAAKHAHDVAQA